MAGLLSFAFTFLRALFDRFVSRCELYGFRVLDRNVVD